MKDFKQSDWEFSNLEYELIASFLWTDINDVKKIFRNTELDGLGLVLLSNAYLVKNKLVKGWISDLEKIATAYSPNGMNLLNSLFSSQFYVKRGPRYFSKDQLIAMNKMYLVSARYADNETQLLPKKHTAFPEKKYIKVWYMRKVFNNMLSHVNVELPKHIKDEISRKEHSLDNFSLRNFYKIMNAYISIDSSFIGFTELLDIQLNILHKDRMQLEKVFDNSNVWKYDERHGIIYDPVQRKHFGLSPVPDESEIRLTMDRRMNKYINMLNFK